MTTELPGAYPFDAFVEGLTEAGAGVVRVESTLPSPTFNTGWLITDSLVVLPRYCLGAPDTAYRCTTGPQRLMAELEYEPGGSDPASPALLRLQSPVDGAGLRLHVKSWIAGDQVVVLHYPGGGAQLQLSIGHVISVADESDDNRIVHDASTTGGSGGAPVLSAETMHVLGMHIGKTRDPGGEVSASRNQAIGLVQLLDELRSATCWPEIVEFHSLVDVATVASTIEAEPDEVVLDADLVGTALRWSVDPAQLDESLRDRARPLVVDPDEPTWSIAGDARRRLIKEAASLETLQEMRPDAGESVAGQRAIDRIVDGPPYDLDAIPIDELPYWLQAVEWFADVVPDLPTPAQVHRSLARRRVRERLRGVAATKLWGREAELKQLTRWYEDPDAGPVVVTGVGGVGKSALLARFALGLPSTTMILWLDFDRADLAPDDAVSVLASIAEQAAVQVDDFARPTFDESDWEAGADALADSLAAVADPSMPPLLVLDGFEIAQHVKRHGVIWEVIERIMQGMKAIRVVVSGRAPVSNLTLGGEAAKDLHLVGLADDAAKAWLADRNVREPTVVSTVMQAARGIPLILKMAVRLIDEGGNLVDDPETLQHALIVGYLYRRILDRVVDPRLRPLARDALILRRLPEEMIPAVLGDRIPESLDSAAVFAQLSRELALVDSFDASTPDIGGGPLRMRAEVRAPLLRLLETDNAERVKEIDRRAAQWYAGQGTDDAAFAAELVYHRLRLGDISGAADAWRNEAAPLLLNADDDIAEEFRSAREWLVQRTTGVGDPATELEFWESDANQRIRSLLARGHPHSIRSVLKERADRRPNSPLIAYDAWQRWALDGDPEGALRILAEATPGTGEVGEQRTLLRAFLTLQSGDRETTDALLATLDRPDLIIGDDGPTGQLAVKAARVRLTVDFEKELRLGEILVDNEVGKFAHGLLASADLVLPSLSATFWYGSYYGLESFDGALTIPETPDQTGIFAANRIRKQFNPRKRTGLRSLDELLDQFTENYPSDPAGALREFEETARPLVDSPSLAPGANLALDLFLLARRRWLIADTSLFLAGLAAAMEKRPFTLEMHIALVSTLAVFRGEPMRSKDGELNHLMIRELSGFAPDVWLRPVDEVGELAERVLRHENPRGWEPDSGAITRHLASEDWESGVNGLYYFLCGPDPLAVLCQRALGFSTPSSSKGLL